MKNFIKNFAADEAGASAAEYALIIAVVGVGIGAAALVLGANVKNAVDGASEDVFNCNNADPSSVTIPAGGKSKGTECEDAASGGTDGGTT